MRFSAEVRDAICADYRRGDLVKVILNRYRISQSHLVNILDERGIKRRPLGKPRSLTDAQIAELRREYGMGGITAKALARRYGVSGTTIGKFL